VSWARQNALRAHTAQRGPIAIAGDFVRAGRLLVYFPESDLGCGAAEAETHGFFDVHNCPAWDTWVGIRTLRYGETRQPGVVCWIPAPLVALVTRGIDVSPEECIAWLDRAALASDEPLDL
jgi:hypothetical protein